MGGRQPAVVFFLQHDGVGPRPILRPPRFEFARRKRMVIGLTNAGSGNHVREKRPISIFSHAEGSKMLAEQKHDPQLGAMFFVVFKGLRLSKGDGVEAFDDRRIVRPAVTAGDVGNVLQHVGEFHLDDRGSGRCHLRAQGVGRGQEVDQGF